MECLIGIQCDSFTILAHDNFAGRSILAMKQDQDKLFKLDDNVGIVVCGEAGDTVYFGEYVQKNIALYRTRNGYSLSIESTAHFTRNELAESLRSRRPFVVNLLLGGFDSKESKSYLYWMDYLGTLGTVPYGAQGYGSNFVLGLLDRYHRSNMTVAEGVELLEKCVKEIQKRLIINLPSFSYYVIDSNGFSEKRTITASAGSGEGAVPSSSVSEVAMMS